MADLLTDDAATGRQQLRTDRALGLETATESAEAPEAAEGHRLDTLIQHHPARAALAAALADVLSPLRPRLVSDPEPEQRWNSWRVYRHCLEQLDQTASHALIIQDDALPCRNFVQVLPRLLTVKPDSIIALYVGGGQIGQPVVQAGERCHHWTLLSKQLWVPLVATLVPLPIVQELLAWAAEDSYAQRARWDDAVLGRFCRARNHRVWATVPNLVQHPDVVPSLARRSAAAGRDKHRVAACYIGEYDPLQIAW